MYTSSGRSAYLVVAAISLASRYCDAFFCHICGAVSATEGDPCNLDNVCESDACYLVKHANGTWNATCTEPDGPPYERSSSTYSVKWYSENWWAATKYGACEEDLCNDPKRTPKAHIDFILPKGEDEVTCNICGYPKAAAGIGNRSIACARDGAATCSGEFCVTIKGDRPRYFCGDAWLLAHIGRNLSDILGCQTLPNGEEHCVCDANDCNKPAAGLGPGRHPDSPPRSRRLYEAVAGHIEDVYASASSEEKTFIQTLVQHLHDHVGTNEEAQNCCPTLVQTPNQAEFPDGVLTFTYNDLDCRTTVVANCSSPDPTLGLYAGIAVNHLFSFDSQLTGTCTNGVWQIGSPQFAIQTLECRLTNSP